MPHWTTAAQRSTGPSRLRELGLRALFQSNRKRKAQHSYGRLAMAEACESRVLLSSLTVNSALDNLTPGDGLVTLREAIIAANNDTTTDLSQTGSGADVIQFDASLANQTINLTLGELEISSEVTIEGLGANLLTVDAGNSSRVFLIDDGDNNNDLNVSISGLTISGGLTLNTDATTNAGRGGGIHSYENLVLTESHVANNETQSDGGGIWIRYGDLTLLNSTVSGNIGKFLGGGIYARQNQVLISNSTISGNVLTAGNSGVSGGGFYGTGNTVTIRYSTITDNTAMRGGGVLGADTLSHTIVAGNTASQGPDLFGSVTANFSLIGDTTDATISGADNITNTSADLDALADNGGPVPTHKLAATSPAINAGDATLVANVGNVPEFDQRGTGFSRVNGSSIDIGAYEYNAVSLVGTGGSFIDTFTVFMDGTEVVVDLNMAEIFRQELSTVDSLELNGLGGTDTFNIDQSGGTLTLPISIIGDSHLTIVNSVHSITAGGDTITKTPVKGDILNFLDSSNTSASNYRIDSDSISRTNSGIVTFSGIEVFNVYTSTSAASDIDILTTPGSVVYTVNAGDQADDIDVTTSATNGVLIINAGGGSDSIDIAGTGDSPLIFLRGDDGNDLINVADTGSSLSFGLDIDGGNDDDTITIQNIGTALLNVSGDAGNDQINLMNSDASSLSDLFGGADDDTFTVAAGLSGVRVFGDGQGMVGDQLNMTGGSFTNVTYDFDNANDGSINYDGSTITYTGLEPITDTTTATNRTFEFNGAEETITLSDDSNADDGVSFIDSTLGESVTFNNPTGLLTINTTTGSGADTVNVEGLDSLFDASLTITADSDAGEEDSGNFQTNSLDLGSGNLNVTAEQIIIQPVSVETTGTVTFTGAILGMNFLSSLNAGGAILFDALSSITMNGAISTTSGDITLNANTIGAITDEFFGILSNSGSITTESGTISLTGVGGNTLVSDGILLTDGATISSTTGTITLNGTGKGYGDGVVITGSGTTLSSISGDITITGNSTYYDGVSIQNGAAINSTGTDTTAAKITISGTTGTGFDGIYIEGANTTISSISGDISLTGNSDGYNGVYIGYGAKVKSTGTDSNAAKISIMGTTTSTYSYEGEYSNGVWLYGTDTEVSSISGNITITGSSTKDNSVVIEYDAVVKSTGTGVNAATITIQGTSTADGDDGVEISDGAHISSVDGNISITGSSEDDDGVNIQYGAIIESTGTGALAATITITGTGVNDMDAMNGFEPDDGIDFDSLAQIRSTDGNILLTGTTSADRGVTISASQISTDGTASVMIEGTGGTLGNSDGVNLGSVGQINLTGSGNLDLTGTSTIGAEIRMALGALGFITTTGGTQTYNSNVVLDDDSELSGADIDFLDGISGASMLTLSPTGTATLAAGTTSDFTGNITVTSGTLLALGDTSDQTATVNIQDGATLAGTGSVLANVTVESGGILGPGQSPGILTTGNLSLQTGATFDVEINGRAAGTEYDQVSVTGTVNLDSDTLGGATLNLLLGYTPVGGEQYTIIENDDVDAISGTFNGLAEGATFVSGGVTFGISYVGGDGNDVVLSVKPPTTIVVTTATDEADGTIDAAVGTGTSLREAILAANLFPDTNIITFDSSLSGGTILIGDSGLNLDLLISTDLTIDGSSLMTPVIVDAERDNRVFTINSGGTGIEVTLDSLTIQNGGLVTNGGNIRVVNAADTLNLLNSTVSGGRASANGGGLDNNGGTVVIDNVTFTNDRAIQFGGAIFNSGDLTVQNTTISGNQSISSGGAIYNKGTLQVSYSLIDDNLVTADLYAGGIYNKSGATAVVTGSTISNNEAGDEGGGIWNQGTFTLLNSTVSGNISDIDDSDAGGAGIYNNGGTLNVINSTVSGNNAGGAGGGIFAKGTVNIVNSTIFGNTANNGGNEGGGGGIFANNNNLTLSNSIVINNDDVLDGSGDDIAGGTVNSNGFNIIGDVTGATINVVGMGTDITGVLATDVLETTLANNGGPTLTHALFRNSLAINAGNDTDALDTDFNPLVTDQRGTGFSRFVGTVDVGAVEADFMDLSVTIADSTDPVVTGSSTTYTVTIANAGPNTATGAAFDNTITYAGGSYTLSNISLLFSSTGSATLNLADGNGPDLTNLILAGGETATLTYTLTVDAGTGVISNVGTLTAGAETDIDNSNDSATEETLVIPPATILVTTATDEADGTIDPSQGTGTSLREAIIAANLNPDVNTIIFDSALDGSPFSLTRLGASELAGLTGDLNIASEIVILGNGISETKLDGNGTDRVFRVDSGSLTLENLWVTRGNTLIDSQDGAGILNFATLNLNNVFFTSNFARSGGGIYNAGQLTINNSTLSGNGALTDGGGIFNNPAGLANISNSTISDNVASNGLGGGIANQGGDASVVNSTLSGNHTGTYGGGIYNNGGTLTVTNSTITGNTASSGAGIYSYSLYSNEILNNTIVIGNNAPIHQDISGTIETANFNLIGISGDSGITNGLNGNIVGATAASVLDPNLTVNGGPTLTHALIINSPAINAGSDALAVDADSNPLTTDQRGVGFNRISGTVDIGAFEFPNSPPDLQPQSFNAAENQTQIGTIQATDPDLPNEMLTFSLTGNGDDASLFSLSSAGVLTFLAAPDFENPADSDQDNIYEVEVLVSDQYGEMATALIPVTVTDVNEAPSIALQPVLSTIAEDVDTSSAIKIADILITDDQLGSETLSLTGNDANLFEVVGTELFLKAGAVLDFETNPALDVTVQVDDLTVGMTPDDTDSLTVLITDANEAPTITLTNVTSTLLESIDTTNRIVVETFTINDDALGTNNLSLSGDDAALFEIVGSGLFLKAGVQLNASLNPVLNVTISVDDPSLGMGAEDSAAESIEIIVPTVNLLPEFSSIIGFVNGNFWITRPSSTTLSGFQTSVAARTSFTAAEITTSVQGDFNGDGLEDVAVWLTNGEWHVGLSNTNRELEFSLWTTWRTYDVKEINVGDFNGDGLDDIAALFKAEEQANLWVFESTGTQFLPDLYGRYTGYDKILATLVGNFDGQYGDDLVIHNNSGAWWVATSDIAGTEATFSLWFRRSSDVNRSISHYQVGDFNDDGLPDVLALYDVAGSTTNFDVMVGLSTGSSFDQTSWFRMTVSQNLNAFVVGDFNGDGRTDIAALLNNRRWWVGLSNGLDEFQWSSWGVWNFAAGIQTVVVGDTNGDGRADILGRDASNYWWSAESNGVEFTTRQIVQWSSTAAWSNIHVGRFTSFGLIGSADSLIQDQSPVVKSAGTTGASPAQAESVADQILDAATFELFGASELLELLYGM